MHHSKAAHNEKNVANASKHSLLSSLSEYKASLLQQYLSRQWITSLIARFMGPTWGPDIADNKVHGANMGPSWGRKDPGGSLVGPKNLAIWDGFENCILWANVFLMHEYNSVESPVVERSVFHPTKWYHSSVLTCLIFHMLGSKCISWSIYLLESSGVGVENQLLTCFVDEVINNVYIILQPGASRSLAATLSCIYTVYVMTSVDTYIRL